MKELQYQARRATFLASWNQLGHGARTVALGRVPVLLGALADTWSERAFRECPERTDFAALGQSYRYLVGSRLSEEKENFKEGM